MPDKVLKFWEEQAKEFGTSDLATAPDHYYRELEISRIMAELPTSGDVLDIGCGNGYSTIMFKNHRPGLHIIGADYSTEMIKAARKQEGASRVQFVVGDVRNFSEVSSDKKYDCIISERCLINLDGWSQQRAALANMRAALKQDGKIILVENTDSGLQRLNQLRFRFGLHAIQQRWHNHYLPEKDLRTYLAQNFIVEKEVNIGNLYYIVSRVLYASIAAKEGMEPRYDHPINEIASQLPHLEGNYSPNYLWILRNNR